MKLSLNWLKEFVCLDDIAPSEIALKLTLSTAEIEGYEIKGENVRNVVLGEIINIKKHEDTGKSIVIVDTGKGGHLQTYCGAPDLQLGQRVACALSGGSLCGIGEIKEETVHGILSSCVLASEKELGISDDDSRLYYYNEQAELGTSIKDLIQIDDVILEVDNKAITHRPDLWGHYGFARELAAIFKRELGQLQIIEAEKIQTDKPELSIEILKPDLCYRYTGLAIGNVPVVKSPDNIRIRLYYLGMRAINLIVDLSNYILLETGQPTHCFDYRLVKAICVDSIDSEDKFNTLDGVERILPENSLLIKGPDKAVALAGIMGGEESEIKEDTTTLLLESANFNAAHIRKTSMKTGLRTESSMRFEKSIDPELTIIAVMRFLELLSSSNIEWKLLSRLTDRNYSKYEKITLDISYEWIREFTGHDIAIDEIKDILSRLHFKVIEIKKDNDIILTVEIPSFRATRDISIKEDIAEEISRIYGFDNIKPVHAFTPINARKTKKDYVKNILKHFILEGGFTEIQCYPWFERKWIETIGYKSLNLLTLRNPALEGQENLKDTLIPNLLMILLENTRFEENMRIVEISKTFSGKKEYTCLAGISLVDEINREKEFHHVKSLIRKIPRLLNKEEWFFRLYEEIDLSWVNPHACLSIEVPEKAGYFAALHPDIMKKEHPFKGIKFPVRKSVWLFELNLDIVADGKDNEVLFREPLRYQSTRLDFSILAEKKETFDEIWKKISSFTHENLLDIRYRYKYEGSGLPEKMKSLTFCFEINGLNHTLSGEEIEEIHNRISEHITKKGFSLR
ncbi:MAG: phenylalanine--tRNA ligase subunit beta [Candidatus Coatesbacteria bacterium]|nr:phenylalanine--tRNA ligase subunit beta [Candidatus Coatesbacteria bacterium]